MAARFFAQRCLSRMLPAGVAVALLSFATSVLSQSSLTENEAEQTSRNIALEAAKSGWLRWPSNRFPLRLAFAAGENVRKTGCVDQWKQRYDEYVKFINAKQTLLIPTPISDPVDAFVFFGSNSELHALPVYRLQETWLSKPGVSILFQNLDRYNQSYSAALGASNYIEFSAVFQERSSEGLLGCDAHDSTRYLGVALVPTYMAFVSAHAGRLFKDNAPPTLEWRAHRRLLSAMTRLPLRELDAQTFRSSLIEALSNE